MKILEKAEDSFVRWNYAKTAKHLASAPPKRVEEVSEFRAIAAFKRAATGCPGYKRILKERGVVPAKINTIGQFKKYVPILDKETVFSTNAVKDFSLGGSLKHADYFWSSSGQSGSFSFATDTRRNFENAAYGVEFLLSNTFDVLNRRTLLINCTPMGVRIPTRTIAVADTSVRSDVAIALIKKLAREFDQFILVGESLFLKTLLEEGRESGVGWEKLVVHLVAGGEFIPESWRTYAMHILGIENQSVDSGIIAINMGVSELSTVIFTDNLETIHLRQRIQKDETLRRALVGDSRTFSPEILQFFPMNTYIESIGNENGEGEIVVTLLNPSETIPLIRYNTKDLGEIVPYNTLSAILKKVHCEHLLPKFHLPLSIIWGRNPMDQEGKRISVHPNRVKELLYEDHQTCSQLTGNFRIENFDGPTKILFQLRPGFTPRQSVANSFGSKIETAFRESPEIALIPYREFPYGVELNYERKMRYF